LPQGNSLQYVSYPYTEDVFIISLLTDVQSSQPCAVCMITEAEDC